jgi:hypothetical protein
MSLVQTKSGRATEKFLPSTLSITGKECREVVVRVNFLVLVCCSGRQPHNNSFNRSAG